MRILPILAVIIGSFSIPINILCIFNNIDVKLHFILFTLTIIGYIDALRNLLKKI